MNNLLYDEFTSDKFIMMNVLDMQHDSSVGILKQVYILVLLFLNFVFE